MRHHQTQPTGEFREIADLTETERYQLLASERRRILTTILSAQSPPVDLETLAKKIAERDIAVETVDDDTVDQMMTILHHKHLPMMADMGILETDPETKQIDFAEGWSY